MAKFARNRVMMFGSWTGAEEPEFASISIGDSKGITKAEIVAATFGTKVNNLSDEYVFTYGKDGWELNGSRADLGNSYGVTLTGEPAEGDIVVVLYTAASGGWEALGKDNDDLSKELNPDTEITKNVLGETTMTHSGYEPSVGVDPYYIDPSRLMYRHLQDIAMREVYDEANCVGYFAEAFFETANAATQTMSGYCYVRRAWFIPESVGGDTAGMAIPVAITPIGGMTKKKIVYDMATNQATVSDL